MFFSSPSLVLESFVVSALLPFAISRSCTQDTGGTCGLFQCNSWRNAMCEDGKCVCPQGTCSSLNGECVADGACPKFTTGSCSWFECGSWRQATCIDHACVCDSDFLCAVDGACVSSSGCNTKTDTDCFTSPCPVWQGATCSDEGMCSCNPANQCAHHKQCVTAGDCPYNIGVACSDDNPCEAWRGASCLHGFCMCNASTECATNGQCLQKPAHDIPQGPGPAAGTSTGGPRPRISLVLSGGGAKGAFELGVLEGLCARAELTDFRGWDMILGTSIGALGAGLLAQFPKEQQCSHAVPYYAAFWHSTRTPEDVWDGSQSVGFAAFAKQRDVCLANISNVESLASNVRALKDYGGMCNPSPGSSAFQFEMNATAVANSGVALRVVAVSLNTGEAKWWKETDYDVVSGCMASGSLAPVVFPKFTDGEYFIDGGFYSNTPILKALEEGTETVLVIILDPVQRPSIPDLENNGAPGNSKGIAIMQFELDFMQFLYFSGRELVKACDGVSYPGTRILGYVPNQTIGSVTDFDSVKERGFRHLGYSATESAPADICELFHEARFGRRRVGVSFAAQPERGWLTKLAPTLLVASASGLFGVLLHYAAERRSSTRNGLASPLIPADREG